MNNEIEKRQSIIDHCIEMNDNGLNQGTSGNLSIRHEDGMLISPSGVPYKELNTDDIVFVHPDGTSEGKLNPSSEWRFHLAILQGRPDVNAVVHNHPTYCTALAIRHMEIPAMHYMIAAAGGDSIPCADYQTFGTQALSEAVLAALEGRSACLMANHGMVACGPSMKKAMWLAVEVETLARQYVLSLQLGGPHLLSDEQIGEVIEKFKTYGAQPNRAAS